MIWATRRVATPCTYISARRLLAPITLLVVGGVRAFAAWLAAAAVIVGISLVTLGPHGFSAYLAGLTHLPSGANHLTLQGTFGLTGIGATGRRRP